MEENTNQRKSGAMLSYVSIIANTLVQLLYTPFLIRMLGQSEYGLYSLVASIIGYLTVLDLGFGNAIVIYTAKYRAKKEYDLEKKMQGMFKIIFFILGFLIGIIGLVLYFNVDKIFASTMSLIELREAKTMMLILTFNLIVTFAFNIYSAIINAYEKFVFQKVLSILNTLLKPAFMIPLLLWGYKAVAMCVCITIVNLFVVLSNYVFCKKKLHVKVKYCGFDKKLFGEMFGYSFFIFLGVIVDKVNWSLDNFILGAVSGTIAVSIYSLASQLNQLFINLSTAISSVLLPKVSKMVATNVSNKELSNEMTKVGRIQYYIIFLMASGLVLFGKEFFILWAGEEYITSYYVALILILPICVPLIQNLGLSIMQAMNKFKFKAISTAIMAIFNAILSIYLAKRMGAIGSAIGTAMALTICNIILMNIYYYKVLKLDIISFWKEILKMTIVFCIPLVITIALMHFIQLQGILYILIFGVIYTVLFAITAYLGVTNTYEKNIVNSVLAKIFKRNRKEKIGV